MPKDKNIGWNLENSYSNLPKTFFKYIKLNPVNKPKLVKLNEPLAKELGLDLEFLKSKEGIDILSASGLPENSKALAQAYAGHQFGHFTMLGDGRALLIGEQITPDQKRLDIQLKGSGRTPYSRGGDGRASLGPMLREYIISEAMHGLRIPTTRSLAVVKTGDMVFRQTEEIGSIMTRVASSHLRVGTFQYAANFATVEELKELADYAIDRHFPQIKNDINPYASLLEAVIKVQANTIAKWQGVGFIHGVMNTDNMTISGETIDYGPCAFMDRYDPSTVFSSIDRGGRYSYENQPGIANWNLARFAESLLPLIDIDMDKGIELAKDLVIRFKAIYEENWMKIMLSKLGIFDKEDDDEKIVENLLRIMHENKADYTNTFRSLTIGELESQEIFKSEEFKTWEKIWKERLKKQGKSRDSVTELMMTNNPSVIPRNHRVEEALQAASKEDLSKLEKLLKVLENPYEYSKEQEEYMTLPDCQDTPYRTFCGT